MMNADDRLAVSIGTINIIDSLESPTTGNCVFHYILSIKYMINSFESNLVC